MERSNGLCPRYARAVSILSKRWTGLIVRVLMDGHQRFGQIAATIDGLSDRVLSERLKELEAEGIVQRLVIPDTPVRVEYALTEKGRDLERVLGEIQQWADKWEQAAQPAGPPLSHPHASSTTTPASH